jgi:hypothetical protein
MGLFNRVVDMLKGSIGQAAMPVTAVRHPQQEFNPEELRRFICDVRDTQRKFGEERLHCEDMENAFSQTNIDAGWTIASSNLSVLVAGLSTSGHGGAFLWFEGAEAPVAIATGGEVFECVPVLPRRERLELFSQGAKVGECYAMPGWVDGKPGVMGWIAMIDTNKSR